MTTTHDATEHAATATLTQPGPTTSHRVCEGDRPGAGTAVESPAAGGAASTWELGRAA